MKDRIGALFGWSVAIGVRRRARMNPDAGPRWAAVVVWGVVNAVNVLQTAGFLSRVRYGMTVNHVLGLVIAALAVPATAALVAYLRAGSGALYWLGPAVFDAFVVFMLVVEYLHPIEFRSPRMPAILVPYLVLFFGSIVLMGLPMFRIDRSLWGVTVVTSALLLASMGYAMFKGVG